METTYDKKGEVFELLDRSVYAALETYSNVHRGSGHFSMLSTHLYEKARAIVLEHLGLGSHSHTVIFCTTRRADILMEKLGTNTFKCLSSKDIGLSIGVRALAVQKKSLPKGVPFQTGGGTTKLISTDWVIWADAPDRFEAGTPAIINIITFVRALSLYKSSTKNTFLNPAFENLTARDILYKDGLDQLSGRELFEALRKTLIGHDIQVPTRQGTQHFVNLDHSASTPSFTPIWQAFRQTWTQADAVKQEVVQQVKSICAEVLGAPLTDYDVFFTSNTTEAINLAAENQQLANNETCHPVILNTYLEHSSNDLPWRMIPGHSLIRLAVDHEGYFDLQALESILRNYNQEDRPDKKRIKLVAVSGASNVLGLCNHIEEVGRIVHRYGAQLLVDAAQLVAHRKVDVKGWGIDYLAFSAHKVYAPFGSGVLLAKKGGLNFKHADLEQIHSSGEENAAGIAALGKALLLLNRIGMDLIAKEEQALTKLALVEMAKIPGLKIYGVAAPDARGFADKLGVIVFGLRNMMPSRLAKKLAMEGGIGVRYGCHCAHIIIKRLLGIGPGPEKIQRVIQGLFPKFKFQGLVRVSVGIGNSEADVHTLIRVLGKIADKSAESTEKHGLSKKELKQQLDQFTKERTRLVFDAP